LSALTKHLVWTPVAAPASERAPARPALAAKARGAKASDSPSLQLSESVGLDIALPPREQVIYMLHIGAEVEHALMVQYLYAAYSLGSPQPSADKEKIVRQWRDTVVQIAREEMGHWAAVENLLTLLSAPLHFDREEFPIPSDLYPFPFELEPLTKRSLGKYVLAEMPTEDVVKKLGLENKIDEIRKYVGGAAIDTVKVHRVGVIYDRVKELFRKPDSPQEPPIHLPQFVRTEDILADSVRFQARLAEWGLGYNDLLIAQPIDRKTALAAIDAISLQGEGSNVSDLKTSHFGLFLDIYNSFPDDSNKWRPSRPVAKNPTTDRQASADRRITNELALSWAKLFNLRYHMLLFFLVHSFDVEAPADANQRTPRGLVISWAFGEMYNLRSIANILTDLPLKKKEEAAGKNEGALRAGPPFEMPYSLALAPRESGRWRRHRDLLEASQTHTAELQSLDPAHARYLQGLHAADQQALAQITTLLGEL
jgi:Ferritin-like